MIYVKYNDNFVCGVEWGVASSLILPTDLHWLLCLYPAWLTHSPFPLFLDISQVSHEADLCIPTRNANSVIWDINTKIQQL